MTSLGKIENQTRTVEPLRRVGYVRHSEIASQQHEIGQHEN